MLAVAMVAACSSDPEAAPTPEATAPTTTTGSDTTTTEAPTTTTTTTVVLPPPVPVAWDACGGGLQCARVTVPVDYADPGDGTLELALVRRPASDPARRIGSLLVNPGGPGASGVRRVERGFTVSPEVAARFDVIGFDPRGVGGSTPVTCGDAAPAFRAADLDPDSDAERRQLAAAAQAVAEECAATEGERLGHLGTIEVVHDVEVIRRALGEQQVSFVGLSYGTLIGLLWAEAYPASVRAMVLDGVVDPSAQGGAASAGQVDAIDASVRAMDDACAADPRCPARAAGGLLAGYDELARRIEANEVSAAGVGPTQLAYAAFYATYGADLWPRFWSAVSMGLAGDLSGVADLARSFTRLVDYAPFALVTCLDGIHPVGFDAWQAEGDSLAERSPRFGRTVSNELLPCAWWPQSRLQPHRVVAPGAPPILVIGSTGDAATPYEQAEAVAATLARGALLTVEIEGHVALGDSACATEAATRYLVDLAVPAPGHRC
jgi:pimeloyl-ACP methyl ester carboxylesterase